MIKLKDLLTEAAKAGDYVQTIFGIAQIEKVRGSIAYMKLPGKKTKGYWMNDLKNLKSTGKKEKGKDLWSEGLNEYFEWSKLDLTHEEEDFFDEMSYKIERMYPKMNKQKRMKLVNDFIVSVIDVYSQPQNDMSDVMSKYGMDDILKHVKRKGLKPVKRAV